MFQYLNIMFDAVITSLHFFLNNNKFLILQI